jgi:hypothetical protein
MITSLQAKVTTLESTLARCLREKGPDVAQTIVDLDAFMTSSPLSQILTQDLVRLILPAQCDRTTDAPNHTSATYSEIQPVSAYYCHWYCLCAGNPFHTVFSVYLSDSSRSSPLSSITLFNPYMDRHLDLPSLISPERTLKRTPWMWMILSLTTTDLLEQAARSRSPKEL